MTLTPNIRRQHAEIVNVTNELIEELNSLNNDLTSENERKVIRLMNTLLGKLFVHLSIKDKVLYPNAIESPNKVLSEKALDLMGEMGDLRSRFMAFREKYLCKANIENSTMFINDLLTLLHALKNRIEREEKELYPLMSKAA